MNNSNKKQTLLKKLAKKNLLIYKLYYFTFFFAQGAYLPLYPIYLTNVAQLTKGLSGTILSINPLISIVLQPIWALINERFKLDKRIVITSIFIVNMMSVLIIYSYKIAPLISFLTIYTLILTFNTVYGMFICSIGPIQDSFTVIYTRKYGFKYGDVRIWGSIGYALSALITGYLVRLLGLYGFFGYHVVVVLCIVFYMTSIVAFIKIKQIKIPKGSKTIKKESNLINIFKNKTFVIFMIFAALSIGALSATGNYFFLYLQSNGAAEDIIGVSTSCIVFVEIIVMMIVLRYNIRISEFTLLISSIMLQVPVLLLFIFSHNIYVLLFALLIRGASQGMFVPVLVNFISSLLPTGQMSSGLTLYSALSIGLTGFTISISGGFIIETFSFSTFFTLILCLVLLSLFFGYVLNKNRKQIIIHL